MNGNESEPLIESSTSFSENRPLFGDRSTNRDRIISLSLIGLCGVLLLVAIITLITIKFNAINLIAILVIFSFTCSHALLIYWYRLGDLDPKFRYLLLWNSINLCSICIVAICPENDETNSSNSLFYYKRCDENFIPIVYNINYDIYFFKIECIHPFDTKKWGKIAKILEQYFNNKLSKSEKSEYFVSPNHYISEEELSLVHSKSFIDRMHTSCLAITKATEVCPLLICPMFITRRKLIKPIKWQTSGSILAGFLALKYGWAINLGGGFHHCSAQKAEGFCLFADITLTIRYLWQMNDKLKFLIVDCDAHQGNGYARDVLKMNSTQQKLVYIMDMFNPYIFPGDETAKDSIDRMIYLPSKMKDKPYLDLLEFHINSTYNTDKFMPDLILYNAGTDILRGDPLGNLSISPQGIAKRDEIVFGYAKQQNCSILMLLSGGYQRNNAAVIASSICNLFDKKLITPID